MKEGVGGGKEPQLPSVLVPSSSPAGPGNGSFGFPCHRLLLDTFPMKPGLHPPVALPWIKASGEKKPGCE